MQAEETWRKIGLAAFHKATSRPWRISRHCSWFTHTPACSPIPHKRFSSVSHFPRFASCIPCFGSCPRSVHDRPLQRLKHSGHFVPSKYTVCNLIFHKVGSLQEADRQSLFPAVFSGKQAAYRYTSRKIWFTGARESSSSRNFNSRANAESTSRLCFSS